MNQDWHMPNYNKAYQHTAMGAILGSLGITVSVYAGDKPGDIIVEIGGMPPIVSREMIVKALNRNDVRPLTDVVTVKFLP